jgi:hypothetical protein
MKLALLAVVLSCLLAAACQDTLLSTQCRNIPQGGCPGQDPGVCIDVTCVAVYTCQPDGTWVHALDCPPREGGADEGGADDASDAAVSDVVTVVNDVNIDVPGAGGGPGCADLQAPDCPLEVAAACGKDCCGCEDLFVCQGGSWALWGQCVDGGIQQEQ